MGFREINIDDILLQQPPFRFIDSVVSYTDESTETCFVVPAEGIFIDDGYFQAAGLMENMAQAMAARTGYIAKYIKHIPIRIGFLGQIRDFKLNRLPACGDEIFTEVVVINELFDITSASVKVRSNGEIIASATIKTAFSNE